MGWLPVTMTEVIIHFLVSKSAQLNQDNQVNWQLLPTCTWCLVCAFLGLSAVKQVYLKYGDLIKPIAEFNYLHISLLLVSHNQFPLWNKFKNYACKYIYIMNQVVILLLLSESCPCKQCCPVCPS